MGCGAYKGNRHDDEPKKKDHRLSLKLPLSAKARIEIKGKKLFTIPELGASQEISIIRSQQNN